MTVTEIRSNTVLPARREPIEFRTSDGLRLVGERALPLERDPVATLITLHPLPTAGGFMDSHVIRKASFRLPALAELAVLRFNTRGTSSPQGTSDGQFDEARGERFDVEAAIAFADAANLPDRWLFGWSFGTDLALMYGLAPSIQGAILLSPPLRFANDADLDRWAVSGKQIKALVPEFDDYLQPREARERFARVSNAKVEELAEAKHLCVGEKHVSRILDEVVGTVRPGFGPLARTWAGPMDQEVTQA